MSWRPATVASVRPESPAARTVVLQVPGWPGHQAGQHVDIRLTADDGYTASRSYSIASVADGELVEVTVERLDDGEVSPYLVDVVAPGDRLEVRGPVGGWFVWRPEQAEPVLLVGGGSGVVPLMSIVRRHVASGSSAPLRLVYSLGDPDAALYRDELAGLAADGLSLTYVYTRRTPDGWPRPPGRLDAGLLAASAFPPAESPTSYVCGPTGFVETAADLLVDAGHDSRRVRTERFGPSGGSS
jgi:ferredoxin-NADP reductase